MTFPLLCVVVGFFFFPLELELLRTWVAQLCDRAIISTTPDLTCSALIAAQYE